MIRGDGTRVFKTYNIGGVGVTFMDTCGNKKIYPLIMMNGKEGYDVIFFFKGHSDINKFIIIP